MRLKPGKHDYELPMYDRLETVTLNDAETRGAFYPLECVPLSQLLVDKQKQRAIVGEIHARPTAYAMEGQMIYFHPTPGKAHNIDIVLWHRVKI